MAVTLSDNRVRQARWAVLAVFFINGALFANWVSRIPQIQDSLALSEGQLGLVLLGISVGVLVALVLVGGWVARFGSQRVTTVGAIFLSLLLPPLAWMPNAVLLWANLFLFGMALSTMDVAMNAQAVEVETLAKKPLMSTFHAAFSIGGFFGAAIGAGMAGQHIEPNIHFMIVAVVFIVFALWVNRYLLSQQSAEDTGEREPVFQLPSRALLPLGIVAFAAATSEGAMADWSGVYLSDIVQADAGTAALGFAVFSIMMTIGRLSGDYLTTRFSASRLVRVGGLIATAGIMLAVLVPETITSLIGFGAVGLGASTIVPLAFSAAGRLPDVSPSVGIAGVATIGYAGFLAGPPVIGLIAEITSLQVALIVVALLASSLIFTASALNRAEDPEQTD